MSQSLWGWVSAGIGVVVLGLTVVYGVAEGYWADAYVGTAAEYASPGAFPLFAVAFLAVVLIVGGALSATSRARARDAE